MNADEMMKRVRFFSVLNLLFYSKEIRYILVESSTSVSSNGDNRTQQIYRSSTAVSQKI